ncbi:hypothetical protein [Actinoplanes teichomyceticus]|nr:hypothetical protein [Actinoplanes teichomyceticus]
MSFVSALCRAAYANSHRPVIGIDDWVWRFAYEPLSRPDAAD